MDKIWCLVGSLRGKKGSFVDLLERTRNDRTEERGGSKGRRRLVDSGPKGGLGVGRHKDGEEAELVRKGQSWALFISSFFSQCISLSVVSDSLQLHGL